MQDGGMNWCFVFLSFSLQMTSKVVPFSEMGSSYNISLDSSVSLK